ncbi:preprotein translocase subunit SecG [Thalassoglobus neptunius]|uniref:Protein-export membrane protein SecG n=1 Tax=Thalassoglobus neptunius TaxID=1938619 RepID=A0A5C5WPQ2_9PLAN|nr:preprotein translocase subunit SecG [Thalassoglobus neptunius]TWT52235.1 preprotein translocase subunit SecG [Thalassoglobus neptunius]
MGTLAIILQVLLLLTGIFLMIIILLQRGRGGGLAGAFGGMGGQSAFGTKAGDVFTWITVVTAAVWVLLAGIGGCAMRQSGTGYAEKQFASGAADDDASLTTGDAAGDAASDDNADEEATPAVETIEVETESTKPSDNSSEDSSNADDSTTGAPSE